MRVSRCLRVRIVNIAWKATTSKKQKCEYVQLVNVPYLLHISFTVHCLPFTCPALRPLAAIALATVASA